VKGAAYLSDFCNVQLTKKKIRKMQDKIVKPFAISYELIMTAYERVRQNKGSAGIDSVSICEYEQKLSSNLYKLWNISTGSMTIV
jgi:hypothetical protein